MIQIEGINTYNVEFNVNFENSYNLPNMTTYNIINMKMIFYANCIDAYYYYYIHVKFKVI